MKVAFGIGTHANSRIACDLPPGYTRFRVIGGIDDGGVNQPGSRPRIEFRIFTDPLGRNQMTETHSFSLG